jgi:hypothetical protein
MACQNENTLTKPTVNDSQFGENAQKDLPFSLKGAPVTNPPKPVANLLLRRKKGGSLDPYFVKLLTEHILPTDPNTTLRANNKNYSLTFMAVHKPLWPSSSTSPELSLVFLAADSSIYHIHIPLTLTDNATNDSFYLNSWLYENGATKFPSAFTLNQLFSFGSSTANAYTVEYTCINKNYNYTLCHFQDPLILNSKRLPSWFKILSNTADPIPSEAESFKPWRPVYFSQILAIMCDAMFQEEFEQDGRKASFVKIRNTDSYVTQTSYQGSPVYYTFDLKSLVGNAFREPLQDGQANLKNIKCYPLDLFKDVDKNGQIVIDKEKKPVRVKDLLSQEGNTSFEDQAAKAERTNTILFYIFTIFLIIVIIGLIGVFIVYFFQGRTSPKQFQDAVEQATESIKTSRAAMGPIPTKK